MELVNKPKQERSKDTQEKLLVALESLLEERFFEQISIRDIAKQANVSSGTIYRRFQNKEALLPILYERYDNNLQSWLSLVWNKKNLNIYSDLQTRLEWVIKEHIRFYRQNANILRTVYIYSRLNGDLLLSNISEKRQSIYEILLQPIWQCLDPQMQTKLSSEKVRCFILILISSINEHILFKEHNPSRMLKLSEREFVRELTYALKSYLSN